MGMWRSLVVVLGVFAIATAAYAGRTAPLVEYENVLVQSLDGKPLTLEQVKKAVVQGGASKQWIASQLEGNRIQFTHTRGGHTAVVEVAYSEKAFSIHYVNSVHLNYVPKESGGPLIHPVYNGWINNLKVSIEAALKTV